MNNLYASLTFIFFLAIFGNGKAVAQIENNLSDNAVSVEPGTILYILNQKTADSGIIFISKNTTLSGIEQLTKSVIVYEEKTPVLKAKAIFKKKISLPKQIASIELEKVDTIPLSRNSSETKIISGSGSLPVPSPTSSQVLLITSIATSILFKITVFQSFQRKGFVFLEIKKMVTNALFARPPTFT